jgi:hypothetical protein
MNSPSPNPSVPSLSFLRHPFLSTPCPHHPSALHLSSLRWPLRCSVRPSLSWPLPSPLCLALTCGSEERSRRKSSSTRMRKELDAVAAQHGRWAGCGGGGSTEYLPISLHVRWVHPHRHGVAGSGGSREVVEGRQGIWVVAVGTAWGGRWGAPRGATVGAWGPTFFLLLFWKTAVTTSSKLAVMA